MTLRQKIVGGAISSAAVVATVIALVLTASQTINVPAGGDIQAAINSAEPGDRIVLEANADYTCSCILPVKAGTAFITIESSRYGEIPVRTFYSSRPTTAESQMMARVRSNHSSEPVFAAVPGAHHYKLLGLDMSPNPNGQAYNVVKLGTSGADQDSLNEVPYEFVIDKSWIRGEAAQEVQRGVALNSAHTAITNTWITDIHAEGVETQAIAGWNGPGPYKIENNYLEAAGINVLFGGADPSIFNLIPSDIEIRRNYFFKPLSWKLGHPTYAGKHWTVKNLFETKNARRLIVEGNRFENNWGDAQAGLGILIKSQNQDGTAPWSVTEDLLFQHNIIRSEAGLNMMLIDNPPRLSGIGKRLYFRNNLWIVERLPFQGPNDGEDVQIEHNTWVSETGAAFMLYGNPTKNLMFRNNLGPHAEYGIKGDGTGEGTVALNAYSPGGWVFAGNVVAGADANAYPTNNFYPATMSEVKLGADYRLAADSPFKGKGTDGKDPGVDMTSLLAAQAGSGPTPTPVPSPSPSPTSIPTPTPAPAPTPVPPQNSATCTVGKWCYWSWPSDQARKIAALNNAVAYGCDQHSFVQTGSYVYCIRVR